MQYRRTNIIQAGLYNTPYLTIAALGDFTFDKLAGASNPAYLAETVEITLSQAIKDKAAALNNDPVKIYHWVRNNVEWLPSWGAIQDADLTLSSQRGNAMDIASLTIPLILSNRLPICYIAHDLRSKKPCDHSAIEINGAARFMATLDKTSIRKEIDRFKTDFEQLSADGKVGT